MKLEKEIKKYKGAIIGAIGWMFLQGLIAPYYCLPIITSCQSSEWAFPYPEFLTWLGPLVFGAFVGNYLAKKFWK